MIRRPIPKMRSFTTIKTITKLSAFKWNKEVLQALLREALDEKPGGKSLRTTVLSIGDRGSWSRVGTPKPLALQVIYLYLNDFRYAYASMGNADSLKMIERRDYEFIKKILLSVKY